MRPILFWPVTLIAILMLGASHLAPKLLAQYQLNLQVTIRDQQILDLEAERQHLKKSLQIIQNNPDYKHKLQLEYLGVKPPDPKPAVTKITPTKNKQKTVTTHLTEAVRFKESESELKQLIFKPISAMRLPLPTEPWYYEIANWLASPEVAQHINLWGIGLLGAACALLHPGKIPSFLEVIYSWWQALRSRYGKSSAQ